MYNNCMLIISEREKKRVNVDVADHAFSIQPKRQTQILILCPVKNLALASNSSTIA